MAGLSLGQRNTDCFLSLVSNVRVAGTSRVEAPVFLSIKVHVSTDAIARQEGVGQDPSFAVKWRAVTMICREEESIVFTRSSGALSVSPDLTAVIEGDHDVGLSPLSPAEFNRHNVGPEPPGLSEDFEEFWS